jgi:hypothetical protein
MSRTRARLGRLLAWLVLLGLALVPVPAAERALDAALVPLRALAEIAAPFALLRAGEVRAAEEHLAALGALEAAENERCLADLARAAEPSDPALRAGRRLVPGEVIGRDPALRDRLRVRLHDARGVVVGLPAAFGDAYVGRVVALEPRADGSALAEVELLTSKGFHVGAAVGDVLLAAGGVEEAPRGARSPSRLTLAVDAPSDRALGGGDARVHELFEGEGGFARLAQGFHLGRVRALEPGRRWALEPELDYVDGIFRLVVLAPEDPALGAPRLDEPALFDERWLSTSPLGEGDPNPLRETRKLRAGALHGVRAGAAVIAIGARLVGRVTRVGPLSCDASLLGDPGTSVVAVARFEGEELPRPLGRLVSLGRDRSDGSVLLRWLARSNLDIVDLDGSGMRRARLFTGSGEAGLEAGFSLGVAQVPVGTAGGGAARAGAGLERPESPERIVRLSSDVDVRDVRELFVRVVGAEEPQ